MERNDDADLVREAERAADGLEPGRTPDSVKDPVTASRLRRLSQIARLASAHRSLGREPNPDRPAPDRVLFHWGPFHVQEKLGEGSFGEVYRAWDPSLRREVALKLRRPDQGGDAAAPRLIEEARRLARVRHPNVLTVYGAAEHDGRVGLWTDLVMGHTLEEWLAEHGPMGAREAIALGLDLVRALAAVHAAGLVHGDIKASNVMRESRSAAGAAGAGRIVLMDFGATRVLGVPSMAVVGTPANMAPEVIRGAPESVASDLYSLGVLLYRLVTGRHPIEAESVESLIDRHDRGERVPLRDRLPDLPASFVQVVEKAQAAEPAHRFRSAGQMEAALLDALGPVSTATGGRRTMLAVLAAVAVLAVAVAIWIGTRRPPAADGERTDPSRLAPEATADPSRPSDPTPAGDVGRDHAAASAPLDVSLYRVHEGSRDLVSSGGTLTPGDHLFMEVQGGEPLHVYVLNEDETGSVFALFPVSGVDLVNPLAPGTVHRLPGRLHGKDFDWVVTSRGGRERFLVVGSRERLDGLEQSIARIEPARPGRPVSYARVDSRALGTLRGVGGMAQASPTHSDAPGRLAVLARDLEREGRERGGLWLRQFELVSAGP